MMCDWKLIDIYDVNFNLWKYHGLDYGTIDTMLPFERDILIAQIQKWIKKENEKKR